MQIANRIRAYFSIPQNCKKWGQRCLVFAVILNGLVLVISLQMTSLQGELQDKRYDEQYFVINDQTIKSEGVKCTLLQAISNQLIMLGRLTDNRLTAEERDVIEEMISELQRQSEKSKVGAITISYLQTNEPRAGVDPFKMFQGKSDEELTHLQNQFEDQMRDYLTALKKQMIKLADEISLYKIIHSCVLVFSTIVLIIGNILNLRSGIAVSKLNV